MRLNGKIRRLGLPIFMVFSLFGFYLTGCKPEEKDPIYASEYGQEFAPLAINTFREYQVDTLVFNKLSTINQQSGRAFQRRVVRSRLDSTNTYRSYQVEVFQRTDTLQPWRLKQLDVEFIRFDGAYVLQEGSIQKQVLAFPFSKGTSWNLNAFNSQSGQTPYTLSFKRLGVDSLAVFEGVRDSTCIGSALETVAFKRNIGLFSRYSYKAEFVNDPAAPCTPPIKFQTRNITQWTLLKYGKL